MSHKREDLKHLFYPWAFVLKEGKEIQLDRFDYSLMLLQVGRPEVVRSPRKGSSKNSLTHSL